MNEPAKLTEEQEHELSRMKSFYPYRIVFGVVDKDTGEFGVYANTTRRILKKAIKDGHAVFLI